MESGPPGRTDPGRSTGDAVHLRRCGQRARTGRPLHSGVPAGDRRAHDAGTTGCRQDNDWGRIGDTPEYLRRKLPELQDRLRASGVIPIDARQPLDQVVDAILSHPAERIWAALKNYVANTAVSWPSRLRQIPYFFRNRSPDQMLATAAPWTSPWLPPGYEQNFWNAALDDRDHLEVRQ